MRLGQGTVVHPPTGGSAAEARDLVFLSPIVAGDLDPPWADVLPWNSANRVRIRGSLYFIYLFDTFIIRRGTHLQKFIIPSNRGE